MTYAISQTNSSFWSVIQKRKTAVGLAQSLWWLGYGLDVRGVVVRFLGGTIGVSLHQSVQSSFGPHPPFHSVGADGSFPGAKTSGRGVNLPPPYNAMVKERLELYLSPPSVPPWQVIGRPLPSLYVYVVVLSRVWEDAVYFQIKLVASFTDTNQVN
jgi:hypothetical protein